MQLGTTSTTSSLAGSTSSLAAFCATSYSTKFRGNQRGGTGIIWALLKRIGHPKFYKPYPKMIDREKPYPRGYKILDFSLFSREDGQSTLEHVARFTVQCGELANYENFYHFKLRLFHNSLTRATFTWYTTLPRNPIQSW